MQDTLHQAAKELFGWASAQRVAAVCVFVCSPCTAARLGFQGAAKG